MPLEISHASTQRPVGGTSVSPASGPYRRGFISPQEQKDGIQAYAGQLGAYIPDDAWFEDQDYSGGNFDRPGWDQLIGRIETGELEGVIVWRNGHRRDRLGPRKGP